jgi:hypothetical protein
MGHRAFVDGEAIQKVTASTTASRGRQDDNFVLTRGLHAKINKVTAVQDDDSVGVVMKNTLTKLALMGPGPLFSFSTTAWMNKP